jgi:hypothetical protein
LNVLTGRGPATSGTVAPTDWVRVVACLGDPSSPSCGSVGRWVPVPAGRDLVGARGDDGSLIRAFLLSWVMHRKVAVEQARSLYLLDPDGPGPWTDPHLSRMLYADGKDLSPLFRTHPGDSRLDKTTGELRPLRAESDAGLHFEDIGETARGIKWVLVAVRPNDVHGRVIVDVDCVPTPGGEAAAAMDSFNELAPHCPGARGVVYDTARGQFSRHRSLGGPVVRQHVAEGDSLDPTGGLRPGFDLGPQPHVTVPKKCQGLRKFVMASSPVVDNRRLLDPKAWCGASHGMSSKRTSKWLIAGAVSLRGDGRRPGACLLHQPACSCRT